MNAVNQNQLPMSFNSKSNQSDILQFDESAQDTSKQYYSGQIEEDDKIFTPNLSNLDFDVKSLVSNMSKVSR